MCGTLIQATYTAENIGTSHVYGSLKDFETAIDRHEHQLKIAKELGDRLREGRAYGNLGNVHYYLGDIKTAIDYHQRHLEIAKELGDRSGEGKVCSNLGQILP